MLKTINGIRLVRFEPTLHAGLLYQWYYSGEYQDFFREYPFCPSIEELSQSVLGKAFVVTKMDTQEVIGIVMYYNFSEHSRRAEIGVLIDKAFEAKKNAFISLRILFSYLFNTCNLYKLSMLVMSENKRLNKSLEVFGAVKEGTLRKHCYQNGKFRDVNVWSMTKPEHNKKYESDELIGVKNKCEELIGDFNEQRVIPSAIKTVSGAAVWASGAAS